MTSILLVCNIRPTKVGAFERYLGRFAERGRGRGLRVGALLSGEPVPEAATALRAAGLGWEVAPGWVGPDGRERPRAFVREYVRALRRGRWDGVSFQFCNELPVAAAGVWATARRVAPARTVWVQHSQMATPGRANRWVNRQRLAAGVVDRLVVLSDATRQAAVARGWQPGRVAVIPNGIPPPDARRGLARPGLGLAADATVLVTVASLIRRKGLDLLLPAVAPHLRGHPGRHLLVVGEGPEQAALTAQATALGVSDQVRLLGQRNDVPAILADADLFVLASRAEGLTYAVLEAMGAGLPVVVTAVGGHPEVVTPAVGEVVPAEDVEAFGAAVGRALADPAAAARIGAAGRDTVTRRYTLDGQVDAQLDLFDPNGP